MELLSPSSKLTHLNYGSSFYPEEPKYPKTVLTTSNSTLEYEHIFSNEQHVQYMGSEFFSDSSEVTHFRSHILSSASGEYVMFIQVRTP